MAYQAVINARLEAEETLSTLKLALKQRKERIAKVDSEKKNGQTLSGQTLKLANRRGN